MPENEIHYLSELVERNIDEVHEKTEFALINYVGLTPEEANRTVNITLQHLIGRNSVSQQKQPKSIRIATDSNPDYTLAEIPLC